MLDAAELELLVAVRLVAPRSRATAGGGVLSAPRDGAPRGRSRARTRVGAPAAAARRWRRRGRGCGERLQRLAGIVLTEFFAEFDRDPAVASSPPEQSLTTVRYCLAFTKVGRPGIQSSSWSVIRMRNLETMVSCPTSLVLVTLIFQKLPELVVLLIYVVGVPTQVA